MAKKTVASTQAPSDPVTVADFIAQGYIYKTSGKFDVAEASFRKATALDPGSYEAYYALGLTLKAQDRRQESIQCFEKVLDIISNESSVDIARAHMLQRLVKAHINQLRSGDWDLEKEIWQHK